MNSPKMSSSTNDSLNSSIIKLDNILGPLNSTPKYSTDILSNISKPNILHYLEQNESLKVESNDDTDIAENDKSYLKMNNGKNKKRSLNDMLKKLAPSIMEKSNVEIPDFLKKNDSCSSQNHDNIIKINATDNLPQILKTTNNTAIKGVYKCMAINCTDYFNQINDLKIHLKNIHPDLKQISCSFCYIILDIEALLEHLSTHIRNVMKCLYCQVTESSREDLLIHLATDHPDMPKKINVCIKILNNERGKQTVNFDKKETKNDEEISSEPMTKIRNRKLAKPIKSQNLLLDEIEITLEASKFSKKCQHCNFSCLDDNALKQHTNVDHTSRNSILFFKCNLCQMSTDIRDKYRSHIAHHIGAHTIRFYSCSYCPIVSNNITIIEDHITNVHPENEFSFQVSQEKIEYLKNVLICPICNVSLLKELYLSHMNDFHKLDQLVGHLNIYNGEFPVNLKVSRSLFRNLLPDAPEQDQLSISNITNVDDLLDCEKDILANDSLLFNKLINDYSNYESLKQYNCEKCNYCSNDNEDYVKHINTHSSSNESLIKQLLTRIPITENTNNNSKLEESVEFTTAQLIAMYGKKVGKSNIFCCTKCPFQCSKTVHFRRHLSIHEKHEGNKEGYKCGYCNFAHNRLNCIKFHLGKYHGDKPYKMSRILHGVQLDLNNKEDLALLSRPRAKRSNVTSVSPSVINSDDKLTNNINKSSSSTKETSLNFSKEDLSLIEFEKKLPSLMIYTDPVKCPKCDFTNRVRINIIRHLKMHRDENSICKEVDNKSKKINDTKNSPIEIKLENPIKNGAYECSEIKQSESRPLLRSILCDNKPIIKKEKIENSEPESLDSNEEEMNYVTRCNLSTQYATFSFKVGESYQCNKCDFIHRYPSKVKRHYYYKHTKLLPYKCGYCNFGAVESGKVKKHCQLIHRYKREMVIRRNILGKKRHISQNLETEGAELINHIVNKKGDDNNGNRWLTQFVTELENGFKCCKLCGQQADDSQIIHYHVFCNHLDSYPYSCNYCGYAFMDISKTKKHIDSHHEKMPYIVIKRVNEKIIIDESDISIKMEINEDDNFDDAPLLDFYPQLSDNDSLFKSNSSSKNEQDNVSQNGFTRKQFKCYYCGIVSKWNRRDIRMHIMHVHMKRRVFTCRYCFFGNSKSKAIVKSHSSKCHPNKPISIRDDLGLYNSIVPIEDNNGIITMAASNDANTPVTLLKNGDEEIHISCDNYDNIPFLTKQSENNASADETEVEYMDSDVASIDMTEISIKREIDSIAWKCKMCDLVEINKHEIKCHIISSHLSLKDYSCPHCNIYLDEPELVISHIDKSHPDKTKNALSTLKEKANYLESNIEMVNVSMDDDFYENKDDEIDKESNTNADTIIKSANRYRNGSFKCLLCGYHDPRNDKTKYHVIKTHLNLRQFSCPHCNTYMWGRQQVQKHIEDEHPGKEIIVRRTFEEYEEFLFKNIKKISSSEASVTKIPNLILAKKTSAIMRLPCNSCSFVTDSELSLAAHKRSHKIYQCMYCDYKHMLNIKVQNHCKEKHNSLPIKLKQINSSNYEATKDIIKDASDSEEIGIQELFSCDSCALHFTTKDDLKEHINTLHIGTYVCQQCQIAKFTEESIAAHMSDLHPEHLQDFKIIKIEENMETFEVHEKPSSVSNEGTALFKCTLCNYISGKLTVMRHHVMSHIRYHPYLCPYCDVIRSVKSFPITKHVKSRHPGKEVKFLYCNNEELEKQVNASFIRTRTGAPNASPKEEVEMKDDEKVDFQLTEYQRPTQRKVLYKCKFCNLKTHIRTDMKHHLMREIQYKPMKCSYCSYTEPCRWSMGKHFRNKHAGIEVKVSEEQIPDKEKEIERLLEECLIDLKNITEAELKNLTNVQTTPFTRVTRSASGIRVPSKLALLNNIYRRPTSTQSRSQTRTVSSFIQKRKLASSPSKVSLKIYRCPHCPYTNTSLKLVRGHMIKHGPHRLKCGYCDYKAHYPSRIQKHNRKHHPNLPFKSVNITVQEINPKKIISNEHVPSSKFSTTTEDRVATDIYVVPDSIVSFKCETCSYSTQNRELYKMHIQKHTLPKWKCYYCDQNYAIIFRLRRHSNGRHPGQPVQWIENATGKVYNDSIKPIVTKPKTSK